MSFARSPRGLSPNPIVRRRRTAKVIRLSTVGGWYRCPAQGANRSSGTLQACRPRVRPLRWSNSWRQVRRSVGSKRQGLASLRSTDRISAGHSSRAAVRIPRVTWDDVLHRVGLRMDPARSSVGSPRCQVDLGDHVGEPGVADGGPTGAACATRSTRTRRPRARGPRPGRRGPPQPFGRLPGTGLLGAPPVSAGRSPVRWRRARLRAPRCDGVLFAVRRALRFADQGRSPRSMRSWARQL